MVKRPTTIFKMIIISLDLIRYTMAVVIMVFIGSGFKHAEFYSVVIHEEANAGKEFLLRFLS